MQRLLSTVLLVLLCSLCYAQEGNRAPLVIVDNGYWDSILTIQKELEEITVIQDKSARFVRQDGTYMQVSMADIQKMPKFFGVSDPVRYIQTLSGISTNSESRAGVHIQGCDDYQSIISINGAPVHYPNHLLGLYSTFIPPHFSHIDIEESAHRASFPNRLGGEVALHTQAEQPERFGAEGSIGVIASDATLTIPCGKKSALWLSGRASYISPIYGKYLSAYGANLGYDFQDGNLTFATHPTDKDDIVITTFMSHDKAKITMQGKGTDLNTRWINAIGSAYYNHHEEWLNIRSTLSASGYTNHSQMDMGTSDGDMRVGLATIEWKNQVDVPLMDVLTLHAGLDYVHYMNQPMRINAHTNEQQIILSPAMVHADEVSLYADVEQKVNDWFSYNAGLRATGNIAGKKFFGAVDPRVTLTFTPAPDHHLYLHGGSYHQYTHKVALLDGGLPIDFFMLANKDYRPERAYSVSLAYQTDFLSKKYSVSSSVYFKQLYDIVESTSNVFSLLNNKFDYASNLLSGDGRNYGWDVMFQRNRGIVTGYVSYSMSWARCKLPSLEGYQDYRYAASHERRHDLKVVVNSQVHKKVNVGAQFVLASGIPYTAPKSIYMIGGNMICNYGTYNGANLPLYHRLDLTCSYDIIKKKDHLFGLNFSLYNVYNHRNAQYVVYRTGLQPSYGSMISRIIPSISIYGRW